MPELAAALLTQTLNLIFDSCAEFPFSFILLLDFNSLFEEKKKTSKNVMRVFSKKMFRKACSPSFVCLERKNRDNNMLCFVCM